MWKQARTSVNEQQWNRLLHLAPLVHKMDIQLPERFNVDIPRELRKLVDLLLLLSPVKAAAPAFREPADVRERRAVVPSRVLELVREARMGEAQAQVVQRRVRDGDLEGLWCARHGVR